jgi:hypothetical protein
VLAAKGDAGTGISSITAGTGLSGGTITTSETIEGGDRPESYRPT